MTKEAIYLSAIQCTSIINMRILELNSLARPYIDISSFDKSDTSISTKVAIEELKQKKLPYNIYINNTKVNLMDDSIILVLPKSLN